ncbi:MAG TPA: hypothetical protein VJ957_10050, partial [Longimicrobiales bacterium]|nr:hypothetical protein [Longimicrobiales bacterium]
MNQDAFLRFLREAGRDYNRPPDTPRDELWAAIRERLDLPDEASAEDAGAPHDAAAHDADVIRLVPRRRWVRWGLALAATLVVGFGLGRLTLVMTPGQNPATVADAGAKGAG